jgi:hypothetical protein
MVLARGGPNTYGANCTVLFRPNCADCAALSLAYRNWVRASKFDSSGRRLCWVLGCMEEAVNGGYCSSHRDEMHATVATRKARPDRPVKTPWDPKAQRGKPLFVLSYKDNMAFLDTVRTAEVPYFDKTWRDISEAVLGRGQPESGKPAVFFVDTENTIDTQGKRHLIELAILSASGQKLLDCRVDHGVPISTIANKDMWEYALRIYGRQNASQKTSGLSIPQIQKQLASIGLSQNSIILEWCFGSFDARALQDTFGAELIPDAGISLIRPWKALGYRGRIALQAIYPNFFPDDKETIAHRALPDAVKAYKMTELLIRHYFSND